MRLTSYGKTFFSLQVASVMKQVDAYSSSTMHLDEKILSGSVSGLTRALKEKNNSFHVSTPRESQTVKFILIN